jgi:hypothetical protein
MDEIFYFEGNWYMAKAPEFVLPPFEFDWDAERHKEQILRDWRWSMTLAPPPISPIIVTGV